MKIQILVIIFLLKFVSINSQILDNEIHSIKIEKESKKFGIEDDNQILLNQKPLNKYSDSIHFKIFFNQQSISLIEKKNGDKFGYVVNRIIQYNYKKKDKNKSKDTYEFYQTIELSKIQIENVINQLFETKQIEIPSDTLIPNWNRNYLHCNSVQFKLRIGKKTVNQNYDCPWNQDATNNMISTIIDNEKYIRKELKLDSIYSEFKNNLPKGKTYSSDGYRMMYIMTEKQNEAWKKSKPEREYLKSKKDTINNYLISLVKNTNIKSEKINCFENYDLLFSPKGKLVSLKVYDYDKPKLKNSLGIRDYLKDKKEIRNCKNIIKKLFKNSDFSFLDLKSYVRRSISFNLNGNPEITDNTIY